MISLAEHVAAVRVNDPLAAVERSVFGTTDVAAIADAYARWCRANLGSDVRSAWMFAVSVGCVAGLRLEDGRRVVVKAYPPDRSEAHLHATQAVQRVAADRGLPTPVPLCPASTIGVGLATADAELAVGRRPNLRRSPDRETAAAGWWRLVDTLRDCAGLRSDIDQHTQRVMGGLYPLPHSPVFDFEATCVGAEWIDALARAARTVVDELNVPRLLVHSDWRGDNIRVSDDGDELVAIFDWDSVRLHREAVALGEVAAMHSIDWSAGDPYFATAGECVAFAQCVEAARPAPFDTGEWAAIRAAIVYGWCYTARCEHAWTFVGPDKPQFRMRARLRADGADLLGDA